MDPFGTCLLSCPMLTGMIRRHYDTVTPRHPAPEQRSQRGVHWPVTCVASGPLGSSWVCLASAPPAPAQFGKEWQKAGVGGLGRAQRSSACPRESALLLRVTQAHEAPLGQKEVVWEVFLQAVSLSSTAPGWTWLGRSPHTAADNPVPSRP